MGLFKKKKSIYVVNKRSRDDVPYILPHISDSSKSDSPLDIPVSPHFGSDVEETKKINKLNTTDVNIYDQYRKEPIHSKDKEIPYKEFRIIRSKKKKDVQEVKETKETKENIEIKDNPTITSKIQNPEIKEPKGAPSLFKYDDSFTNDTNSDSSFIEETFNMENENEESSVEEEITVNDEANEELNVSSNNGSDFLDTSEEPLENNIEINPFEVESEIALSSDEEENLEISSQEDENIDSMDEIQDDKEEKIIVRPLESKIDTHGYTMEEWAIITSGHKSPGYSNFKKPPLSLLDDPQLEEDMDNSWIEENIRKIDENLKAFRIDGQVVDRTTGPTFTRYSVMLAPGVSGSKIEGIQTDLQRALEAISIRIENPIPGKAYVGIEIPNKVRRSVYLKELLNRKEFLESTDPTLVPVGLDVEGNCKFISIQSLPHGIVAGASGSGKSVFVNTLVASLIFKNTPDDVRFFFIDPKKVDLQAYAKIPHLLCPIISENKPGVSAIKWLLEEMERRFSLFRIAKCSNLKSYREFAKRHVEFRQIPYIIAFIDEAGDFFMEGGNEAMDLVTKLIQKCRAAGIHLFLCLQKPVAKLMSTTIKSNAAGRFALTVTSAMDSMIILDSTGAEKLLGRGDMIFSNNGLKGRFQSAYLSDLELGEITSFVERQCPPDYYFDPRTVEKKDRNGNSISIDDLFKDVARYVVERQKCSINQICQDFEIGYNRANEIVKTMERFQIVEENQGTKARAILVDQMELERILAGI